MAESIGKPGTVGLIRQNCTAIDGLRHAQIETAHFLHLAFLAAADHPETAKAIRLTAYSAQIQHSLALNVMEKFSASSKHVVETLLPMILEGIDNKMPEVIKEVFEEIKTVAEGMHSEAKETVQRYEKLEREVLTRMGDIGLKQDKQLRADKKLAEEEVKEKEFVWEEYYFGIQEGAAVHQVEKLSLAEDKAADVTSLVNASRGIGEVSDQLLRIKQFLNQLAYCIDLINKDTRATSIFRSKYDRLKEKVEYSDSNWRTFIVVCDKYVSVCKEDDFESIRKLYKFLSEPIANMTKDERRKRQADIAEKLKERIEALGNT